MHTATADYTLFHPEAPLPTRCHHLLFIVTAISACVLLTIAVSIGLIALACIKLQCTHKFYR